MKPRLCRNCDAFDANSSTCRLDPPKMMGGLVTVKGIPGVTEDGAKLSVTPMFSMVNPDWWCTRFKERPDGQEG